MRRVQRLSIVCMHTIANNKIRYDSVTWNRFSWINSRCTCYFCCCLQHKKSTVVIPKMECKWHSAELTLPCTAAAAVTLQEVPGQSAVCEIPWRLCRWLERLLMLPCFYNWFLHILQTASNLIRTSPSLQKPKCIHTHSPSPRPSAMLWFDVF